MIALFLIVILCFYLLFIKVSDFLFLDLSCIFFFISILIFLFIASCFDSNRVPFEPFSSILSSISLLLSLCLSVLFSFRLLLIFPAISFFFMLIDILMILYLISVSLLITNEIVSWLFF